MFLFSFCFLTLQHVFVLNKILHSHSVSKWRQVLSLSRPLFSLSGCECSWHLFALGSPLSQKPTINSERVYSFESALLTLCSSCVCLIRAWVSWIRSQCGQFCTLWASGVQIYCEKSRGVWSRCLRGRMRHPMGPCHSEWYPVHSLLMLVSLSWYVSVCLCFSPWQGRKERPLWLHTYQRWEL